MASIHGLLVTDPVFLHGATQLFMVLLNQRVISRIKQKTIHTTLAHAKTNVLSQMELVTESLKS